MALQKAIELAGGQVALAERLGVRQSTLSYWLLHSKRGVPGEYALKIEQLTGRLVRRYDLRPDLYPRKDYA